jgi:hypothetical protein
VFEDRDRPGPGGRVVGSTSIRLVDPETPSVEIGGTWLVPEWQRTRANTEAKYLELSHAFEALGMARVELKTDARLGLLLDHRGRMARREGEARGPVGLTLSGAPSKGS